MKIQDETSLLVLIKKDFDKPTQFYPHKVGLLAFFQHFDCHQNMARVLHENYQQNYHQSVSLFT